jgi:integrase
MTARRIKQSWFVDFWLHFPDGRQTRVRKRSPVQSKRGAESYERQLRDEMINPTLAEVKKEVPTLKVFSEEFLSTYCVTNNSPSEQQGKRHIFNKHLLPRFGNRRIDSIGVRDFEAMKAELSLALKPATVNRVVTVLKKTLNYAQEMGLLEKVPRSRLLKVPPQPFAFLDFSDYEQLLKGVSGELDLLVAVLLGGDAGLRRGEINALRWCDVSFPLNKLTVWESIWHGQRKAPKSGKPRVVPLTERLASALRRHRHLGGTILLRDGHPWTNEVFRWQGQRMFKMASMPPVDRPWHSLRHTFCSHLAMRGATPMAIKELAGHSELTTTLRYMHLAPAELSRAIDLLNLGNIWATDGQPIKKARISAGLSTDPTGTRTRDFGVRGQRPNH